MIIILQKKDLCKLTAEPFVFLAASVEVIETLSGEVFEQKVINDHVAKTNLIAIINNMIRNIAKVFSPRTPSS